MSPAIFVENKKDPLCKFLFSAMTIIAINICSCSKDPVHASQFRYDAYKLIRDWYTLDTQFVNRAILWEDDSIWRDEIKLTLDTTADTWLNMCASERFAEHLEHWYYIKNGKKIHPSVYPKT